jgi:Secretion system C-terminal sorting domain
MLFGIMISTVNNISGVVNSHFGANSLSYGFCHFVFPTYNPSMPANLCTMEAGLYDGPTYKFRCFQDDAVVYNPGNDACEYFAGIDDLALNQITLYPNPSKGSFDVQMQEGCSVLGIVITDIHGRKVSFEQLNMDVSNINITLKNATTGNFLVNIIYENGNSEAHRVLVK